MSFQKLRMIIKAASSCQVILTMTLRSEHKEGEFVT